MDCGTPGFFITNSWSLLKLMFIESVRPSNHLILCHPFSFCLQSFPVSGSFPMNQFFTSGGQSIGVSASVLPMNIQDWSPLGWTGWISLQSKRLSRVFSNTTVQKHQFFGAQLCLQSNSHIHTWLLENTIALTRWTFVGKIMSLLLNMPEIKRHLLLGRKAMTNLDGALKSRDITKLQYSFSRLKAQYCHQHLIVTFFRSNEHTNSQINNFWEGVI